MIARVIFRPAAEADLKQAYEWYEERATGLGAEFIRCVDSCVQLVRRHPEIYPMAHKQIRQGIVRRFPYSVLYFMAGVDIDVVAVFHAARDPKTRKQRL